MPASHLYEFMVHLYGPARALQAESDDLERLVLRFCIRPHIMVSPSTADVGLLMWADGDPSRTFLQASLQTSHPAEAVVQ
jgi:hypothetical protein